MNFVALGLCLSFGLVLAAELRNWLWWYRWEDDEDEPNPAPLLSSSWDLWRVIDKTWFWLWSRAIWPVGRGLQTKLPGAFPPPELPPSPVDKDGRTREEWLLIDILGVWNIDWQDEYGQQTKNNWDEFLRTREKGDEKLEETKEEAGPCSR
jgi:hypothetical protein